MALRAGDARERHRLRRLVAAVRVVRARDVLAEAAVALHQVVAAHRALLAGGLVRLRFRLAARDPDRDGVAALRVGGAAEEARAVLARAQPHRAAALFADLPLDFGGVHGVLLGLGDVDGPGALRIAAAGDEEARLAHPQLERMAALGAGVAGVVRQAEVGERFAHDRHREPGLDRVHLLLGGSRSFENLPSNSRSAWRQSSLPSSIVVELVLHARGEPDVEDVGERRRPAGR